mmetsp:Transcript_39193/g.94332  ORF Transcript_39193/g.94332 Transcript_39193/m.94332 type:complete len:252 (-) Transcript_39193:1368-2123(-)
MWIHSIKMCNDAHKKSQYKKTSCCPIPIEFPILRDLKINNHHDFCSFSWTSPSSIISPSSSLESFPLFPDGLPRFLAPRPFFFDSASALSSLKNNATLDKGQFSRAFDILRISPYKSGDPAVDSNNILPNFSAFDFLSSKTNSFLLDSQTLDSVTLSRLYSSFQSYTKSSNSSLATSRPCAATGPYVTSPETLSSTPLHRVSGTIAPSLAIATSLSRKASRWAFSARRRASRMRRRFSSSAFWSSMTWSEK